MTDLSTMADGPGRSITAPAQARRDGEPSWYEPLLPLVAARRPRTESHRPIGREEALAMRGSWRCGSA